MSTRHLRLESVVKKEISSIIHDELRDPRIGFATVTDVELTRDLRHVKVFVSFMGDEDANREGLGALQQAQGFIRTELGRRAYLRIVPEVMFRLDRSSAEGARMDSVITTAKREKPGALLSALEDASKLVQSAQSCFLISHIKPDGDSVGSILALGRLLEKSGKRTIMACTDPVPKMYDFLAGADKIRSQPDDSEIFDLAIVVDCENVDRVGRLRGIVDRSRATLNIDHHPDNQKFGDVTIWDAQAAATGELVYELCEHLGLAPDAEAANALYAALSTDTGKFHFSNVRARTLEIAGDLVRLGADPVQIALECYEKKPLAAVRLHGLVLARCYTEHDDAIVWSEIGPDDFAETGAAEEDTEGIMTVLRSIDGSVLIALGTEAPLGGTTRVSLRANGGQDVSMLARKFGGGGHRLAAGCTIEKPLAEARDMVLGEFRTMLNGESS